MPRVALIGAGLVGRSWAMVFARSGWDAVLYDPMAGVTEQALGLIREGLNDQARHGLVDDPAEALARISPAASLAAALARCDYVQESGPETIDAKRAIWAELDTLTPAGVVIASSTSAIVASRFSEALPGRARCLVGHPVNPPHLIPLVEISPAPWTSPEAIARARAVYTQIGQEPIVVKKEIDGFILNRLQGAVLNEAMRLVGEGYVSAGDLDKTIKDGLGLRWSFMGPFETIELNAPAGIPDYCARFEGMYRPMAQKPPSEHVWDKVNIDRIAADWGPAPSPEQVRAKSRWRDERLAALAAHKKGQPKA
jgi:L-gulonate 3-dehydrogenase